MLREKKKFKTIFEYLIVSYLKMSVSPEEEDKNSEEDFNNLLQKFYVHLAEEQYSECFDSYLKMKQMIFDKQRVKKYSLHCEFCNMCFSRMGLKNHLEKCPQRKGRPITTNLTEEEDLELENEQSVYSCIL